MFKSSDKTYTNIFYIFIENNSFFTGLFKLSTKIKLYCNINNTCIKVFKTQTDFEHRLWELTKTDQLTSELINSYLQLNQCI